jgi:deoxyribodipyrimidine photolyase
MKPKSLFTNHQIKKQFWEIYKKNTSWERDWSNNISHHRVMSYTNFLDGFEEIITELSLQQLINIKKRSEVKSGE